MHCLLQTLKPTDVNRAELKARHDAAEAGVEYEPGQKPVHRTSMVGGIAAAQQSAGTGQYLHEVEDRRAIKVRGELVPWVLSGWMGGIRNSQEQSGTACPS